MLGSLFAKLGLLRPAPAHLVQRLWDADTIALSTATAAGWRVDRVLRGAPVDALGGAAPAGTTALLLICAPSDGPAVVREALTVIRGQVGEDRVPVAEITRLLCAPPFDIRACGRVTQHGDYVLCAEVLHAGTRSEGRRGALWHRGVEVPGREAGEVIDVGAARFVFRGRERPHLWSVSGWDVDAARQEGPA